MLNLCVLGSGSFGNSVYIESEHTRLLIDAGLSFSNISNRLKQIDRDISAVDAIIVTHEHIDHCRGVKVIAKRLDIPVYINEAAFNALPVNMDELTKINNFDTGVLFEIKDLYIETFSIPHDTVEPVGIVIWNKNIKVTVITDLGYITHLVRERARGSDVLVVESNHDIEMLKAGPYPWPLKQRIKSRCGHLSNEECGALLEDMLEDGRLKNVVLAHLSETNNHPEIARLNAQNILSGTGVNLSIANQHTVGEFLFL